MSRYRRWTRYRPSEYSYAEEIVADLTIPGMTAGGTDYGADTLGFTYWDDVQWRDDEDEPLGAQWNEALGEYRLVTLPRSELMRVCGYTGDLARDFVVMGRDLREPTNNPSYVMGNATSLVHGIMETMPPSTVMLIQAPDNDPQAQDQSWEAYHETGDSLFCVDARNIASGKTTLQLVRARVYRIHQIANHHTYSPLFRFRTPAIPAIALPFTVTTASGTLDLICVWHPAEYDSVTHVLLVPHVYLAAIDASSYLEATPLSNRPRHDQRRPVGLLYADVGGCLAPIERAYQTSANSSEQGYAQREQPVRVPYDNRSPDDRRVLIEACQLADLNNEDWIVAWKVYITRGGGYSVGGSNDVVAELGSGSFTRKNIGEMDGWDPVITYIQETTVGALGLTADDLWTNLFGTVVYQDDDGNWHVDSSNWKHHRVSIWPLYDHEQPCPFSSRARADIVGSLTRQGRWWPGVSPSDPWSANTSDITMTVAADKQSVEVAITSDWSSGNASNYTYYEIYTRTVDSRGRIIDGPQQLTSYYENHPTYVSLNRPISQTARTIDTSHAPDWIMVEVMVHVYDTHERTIARARAVVGSA